MTVLFSEYRYVTVVTEVRRVPNLGHCVQHVLVVCLVDCVMGRLCYVGIKKVYNTRLSQ